MGAALGPEDVAFLASYRAQDWPRVAVTVDLVVLTVIDSDLKVLAVTRPDPPFRGRLALPGGFVRAGDQAPDESLDDAAHRVLTDETGLPPRSCRLEQLQAFGDVGRDPRMRVISVAWCALVQPALAARVTADRDAQWCSLATMDTTTLAFDHAAILAFALARLRARLDEGALAFSLAPPTFTIPELRAVYEAVHAESYDPANFRRRFRRWIADGVIAQAPGHRTTTRKPAPVYRLVSPGLS